MAAISLWKTIKQLFLFSLSDEVSTRTKVRLAGFQTTGNHYLIRTAMWKKEIVGTSSLCRTCPMTSMKSSLVHAWHKVGMTSLHAGQIAS